MPETSTKTSAFCVASTRFSARAKPMPVSFAQLIHDAEDELARRSQSGADRRPAQVHHAQALLAFVNAPAVAVDRLGVRAHLAPSVVSTASCISVRPTFTTCAKRFSAA